MAQKYKIIVNSSNTQPANAQQINQIQQQIAQNQANQQLQNQAVQQNEDELRASVNDILKSKLLAPVDVPRFTTIQDIANAQKGERLEKFGEYLGNNPDVTRLVGTLLGGTYMDRYGRFNNAGNEAANRQIEQMRQMQANALTQLKEQDDIAASLNNAYNQRDIADMNDKRARELAEQELNFKKEQNELDRAFKREELEWKTNQNNLDRVLKREGFSNDLERAKIIHGLIGGEPTGGASGVSGSSGGGSSKGGAATSGNTSGSINLSNIKMTAAERKSLTENKQTLANIDSGLKALEKNPDAYQWYKGILGPDIANRIDPKGVGTRTQIDNITAVYRKWLTGAQMSDKERKAYERFLPAPTDNYNIVKAKLQGMRGAVERSNEAILSNYGISTQSQNNNDPLGLGL